MCRKIILPVYLVLLAQVAVINGPQYVPHLISSEFRLSLASSTDFLTAQLFCIFISVVLNRIFPVHLGKEKSKTPAKIYDCSYIDVVWQRIVPLGSGRIVDRNVRIYYPCEVPKGKSMKSGRYSSLSEMKTFVSEFTGLPAGLFDLHLHGIASLLSANESENQSEIFELSKQLPQYPVIIFYQDLNGFQVHAHQMICEKLAQTGSIVVSAQSPGVEINSKPIYSPLMPIPTKEMVRRDSTKLRIEVDIPEYPLYEQVQWTEHNIRLQEHAADLSFFIDALMAVQYGQSMSSINKSSSYFGYDDDSSSSHDAESPDCRILKGRMDLERLMLLGHSSSVSTCIYSAACDRRVKGVIGLDAWLYPLSDDVIMCGCSSPVLLLQSGKEFFASEHSQYGANNDERARVLVSNSASKSYLFRLRSSGHFDAMDISHFFPRVMQLLGFMEMKFFPSAFKYNSQSEKRSVEYSDMVIDFSSAFLHRHVMHRDSPSSSGRHLSPMKKPSSTSGICFSNNGFLRDDVDESEHYESAMAHDQHVSAAQAMKQRIISQHQSKLLDNAQIQFSQQISLDKVTAW